MARKEFHITDQNATYIKEIKKELGFKSEGKTINYIIQTFAEKQRDFSLAKFMEDHYEENRKLTTHIRLGVNSAEKTTQEIKEMLNNYFLFNREPEEAFFPIEKDKHFITQKAEEEVQRRFKIMRDKTKEASRKKQKAPVIPEPVHE
ncbi:hypothetical protein LJH24_002860 [Listeria monocytogenes]|nr:hypothetical protein [Listeria monocytogenes]EAF5271131.1 hypothetical protein [Listeria monocytogenes]EAF5277338.1 hypothetical protein [Listeria monocytogenes]EAF5313851.1 hypothetical protein [Listeria monocytogenes]EAF5353858.1 hypothetical protein [Listeria monocytogenes]